MARARREPIDIEANLRYIIVDWLGAENVVSVLTPEELLTSLSEENRRRLRELLLQEEVAAPHSQPQSKDGMARRTSSKQCAS